MLIEAGHVDGAIAGGADTTDLHFHSGFDAMRAYNREDNDAPHRASRPYAADRAGFIFGEGGGIVRVKPGGGPNTILRFGEADRSPGVLRVGGHGDQFDHPRIARPFQRFASILIEPRAGQVQV